MTDPPEVELVETPEVEEPGTAGRLETPSLITGPDHRARCAWVGTDPEYTRYHDDEWGVPLHGDRALYEKIALEGFQAGLSWITILRRREGFRAAFHGFDPKAVAELSPADVERLMGDERIIRNRAKIEATIGNARALLAMQAVEGDGALDRVIWSFRPTSAAPGGPSLSSAVEEGAEGTRLETPAVEPVETPEVEEGTEGARLETPSPRTLADIPAVTPESTALSKALKARGFRFVGPTTMYALMQSAGLIDDHVRGCWRAA